MTAVRVPGGWLEIYHGNRHPTQPADVGTYYGAALLLDPDDPGRVLRRTPEPILVPTTDFEMHGFVPDVVFPTGVVPDGDTLLVYYGAADTCTAVVEVSQQELMGLLTPGSSR